MLERLAAWFLNTYVADYVGNVDTDQLSIGLLKGAVELEKLPLKKDALRKLKLPFDIKSGYIGKLKLQIPVRYIKSQPWVIQIDQLYVVAGPAHPQSYNAEEEEEAWQAKKQARLDKLEEQWKAEQRKSKSWWFWSPMSVSFPSNVIANLQVVVNDVHIRYEDPQADPAHPFAIGMLLENLSAQSTDRYWEPNFTSGEDMAWKLMDLQNFAVYFDDELLGSLEGQKFMEAILKKRGEVATQQQSMTTSSMLGRASPTECIIKPVSGQARLTRNCSKTPLRISDGPRLHLDVRLDEIPISLSDRHYCLLVKLFEAFKQQVRANRFKKWRPGVGSVRENVRGWWKFAMDAALDRIRHKNWRYSLKFALSRARQNVAYVRGYTQHLTEETVSEAVHWELKEIEKEQSFEELAVLRSVVMNRIKKERDLAEAAKKKLSSSTSSQGGIVQNWFPGWISGAKPSSEGGGPPLDEPSKDDTESVETDTSEPSEEEQLLNELGYEARDNPFLRDRIFLTLSCSLTGGSFQFVTTPTSLAESFFGPKPLVEMTFEALCFSADLRPRLKYSSFDLSLGSIRVIDHSHADSLFPVLVQPKEEDNVGEHGAYLSMVLDQTRSEPLFGFKIVAEEVNRKVLYQLKVHSKPLDIVYNPSTLARVKDFLMAPLTDQHAYISQWEGPGQSHIQTTLSDRLGDMLGGGAKTTRHRVTAIKLDISAPHLILPENFTSKETAVVVVDLGHVTFSNVLEWSSETAGIVPEPGLDDDDDDEFLTPPSSPPSVDEIETVDGSVKTAPISPEALQAALHSVSALKQLQLPHERYLLRLSALQILVGRRKGGWREAALSESSQLHLLDKFILSVKIQRTLKFMSQNEAPTLNLVFDLPSLRFHIDEKKVHTLISCLQAVKAVGEPLKADGADPNISLAAPPTSKGRGSTDSDDTSIGVSMYHSAVGSLFGGQSDQGHHDSKGASLRGGGVRGSRRGSARRSMPDLAQRLLVASEKQISAKFSITEVLLSLNSRGRVIAELNVPGINCEFLKRPYDLALRLMVQDLCLVDRIQTFGPEYELVVCSSGRSLFGFSPPSNSPKATPNLSSGGANSSSFNLKQSPSMASISAELFESTQASSSGSLLALSYTFIKPHSPQHPA